MTPAIPLCSFGVAACAFCKEFMLWNQESIWEILVQNEYLLSWCVMFCKFYLKSQCEAYWISTVENKMSKYATGLCAWESVCMLDCAWESMCVRGRQRAEGKANSITWMADSAARTHSLSLSHLHVQTNSLTCPHTLFQTNTFLNIWLLFRAENILNTTSDYAHRITEYRHQHLKNKFTIHTPTQYIVHQT